MILVIGYLMMWWQKKFLKNANYFCISVLYLFLYTPKLMELTELTTSVKTVDQCNVTELSEITKLFCNSAIQLNEAIKHLKCG
jgi:hypothetical protein